MKKQSPICWTLLVALILFGLVKLGVARPSPPQFVPPSSAERKAAVGSTDGLSVELMAAFDSDGDSFSPIPTPGPSDWLGVLTENGQTFRQYQSSQPNRPDSRRTTIYLQPLGEFPAEVAPDLDSLADFATAFFGMPVKKLPSLPVRGLPFKSRRRQQGQQILTGDVLKWLESRVPEDAYCLLAITMTDLYPDPKWNFVFGQGSLKERVGVYSFARYLSPTAGSVGQDSVERELLLRSCKVLAHEAGHMFGIKHCIHYHCLMNGSNGLTETDAAPIHLCPVCLRKLHAAKAFDVEQRYRTLQILSARFGWEAEDRWFNTRIRSLTADD